MWRVPVCRVQSSRTILYNRVVIVMTMSGGVAHRNATLLAIDTIKSNRTLNRTVNASNTEIHTRICRAASSVRVRWANLEVRGSSGGIRARGTASGACCSRCASRPDTHARPSSCRMCSGRSRRRRRAHSSPNTARRSGPARIAPDSSARALALPVVLVERRSLGDRPSSAGASASTGSRDPRGSLSPPAAQVGIVRPTYSGVPNY